jgi:hypothetical protein
MVIYMAFGTEEYGLQSFILGMSSWQMVEITEDGEEHTEGNEFEFF